MSHHESQARGPDARMVDRMLFFSDAVFAIVLTIMVLEMHAPVIGDAATSEAIWHHVGEMWHIIFAYLISFALVGMWWSVHMRVTRSLHQFDWLTAVFNLVFLLTVSLTPFAASVLGEAIGAGAAWQIYWGVNAASSLSLTLLFIVVSRDHGRLLGGTMTGRERLARIVQSIGPGLGFSVGVYLAGIGEVGLSRWCWVVIPPVMAIARVIYGDARKKAEAEAA